MKNCLSGRNGGWLNNCCRCLSAVFFLPCAVALAFGFALAGPSGSGLAATYTMENSITKVVADDSTGGFSISNKVIHKVWNQSVSTSQQWYRFTNVTVTATKISGDLYQRINANPVGYYARFGLFSIDLATNGEVSATLSEAAGLNITMNGIKWPLQIQAATNETLILPYREGVGFNVTNNLFFDQWARYFPMTSGHLMSMPWWGTHDTSGNGMVCIALTPDDAAMDVRLVNGYNTPLIDWMSQKGDLGYSRTLLYAPVISNAYSGMCARFRDVAVANGWIKPFAIKAQSNSRVWDLAGAAVYWGFQTPNSQLAASESLATNMYQMGMEKVIYNFMSPAQVTYAANQFDTVNNLGYLASRHINYTHMVLSADQQYLPANASPNWRTNCPDSEALLREDLQPYPNWEFTGTNGLTYPCMYLSDCFRTNYLLDDMDAILPANDYHAWFIDTQGAEGWAEDWSAAHPSTRGNTGRLRAELIKLASDYGSLLIGTEAGIYNMAQDAHWFEGKMTIQPFSLQDDAVGNFSTVDASYTFANEAELKASHQYLLPLWELVFHDTVQTYQRWEHANNKAPHDFYWAKKDALCVLYGQPQMLVYSWDWWTLNKTAMVQSYSNVYTAVSRVFGARMTTHEFVTSNKDVQRTRFDNGANVTVNFSANAYTHNGTVLNQYKYKLTGARLENKAYPNSLQCTTNQDITLQASKNVRAVLTNNVDSYQQWFLQDSGDGYFFVENLAITRRLQCTSYADVLFPSSKAIRGASDYPGSGYWGDSCKWKKIDTGNGYFRLQNKYTGLWLQIKDVTDADTGSGRQVIATDTTVTGDSTKWRVVSVE